jgi:cobalt/nickel transport system ATP-binding protein
MSEPLIVLDNVSFSYGNGEWAVEDVSFSIEKGDSIALLGANGSGKSTLIKLIDGLIFPQKGNITAFEVKTDEKVFNAPQFRYRFRKEVSLLFQNCDAQLFCEKVEDELTFTSFQIGLKEEEIKRRVEEIANIFNLKHLLNKAPYTLSEGEKKRVALASLLLHKPTLLLLDEPTAHLDARNLNFVSTLLKQFHKKGLTLVFATHEIWLARKISTKVVLLSENHRVAKIGTTEEITNDTELLKEENLI